MEEAYGYSECTEATSDDAKTVKHQVTEKLAEWSWSETKRFENILAQIDANPPELFEKIALQLPGKTIDDIQKHYYALIEDILMIESGLVPLPDYKDDYPSDEIATNDTNCSTDRKKDSKSGEKEKKRRKKGVPWTKEEHELFLVGIEKYGKGDWRSISRNCVISRTPIQIASHAQKYFLRLERTSESSKGPA